MTLPNFLVIGTPRSGTTSLYEWLQQHPDVFMSPYKEPHFFGCSSEEKTQARPPGMEFVSDFDEYTSLFQAWSGQRAVGEASPCYLHRPLAPQHINEIVPQVKMIALLRNPIDRAFSHYTHFRAQRIEKNPDFLDVVRAQRTGQSAGAGLDWDYLDLGFYARQLRRYRQQFGRDQVKVFLFEDLTKRAPMVMAEICRFLEIDDEFPFDTSIAHNPSYIPKHEALSKVLYTDAAWKTAAKRVLTPQFVASVGFRLERWNQVKPQKLSDEARRFLQNEYRADILDLQTLLDRDLSHWLETQTVAVPLEQEPAPRVSGSAATLPARKHLSPQASKTSD